VARGPKPLNVSLMIYSLGLRKHWSTLAASRLADIDNSEDMRGGAAARPADQSRQHPTGAQAAGRRVAAARSGPSTCLEMAFGHQQDNRPARLAKGCIMFRAAVSAGRPAGAALLASFALRRAISLARNDRLIGRRNKRSRPPRRGVSRRH
jgi:hypothetical protein